MNPKPDDKQRAQALYFQTELSQQQIADMLNVNRKTLYLWIKEGGWKRIKYAASHAPSALIDQYYHQLGAINNHIAQRLEQPWPTKDEADTIRKLTATIKQLRNGKHAMSESIEIFQVFTDKLKRKNFKLTKEILPYMTEHIKDLTQEGRMLNFSSMAHQEREMDQEFEQWLSGKDVDNIDEDNDEEYDDDHDSGLEEYGAQNEEDDMGDYPLKPSSEKDIDENEDAGLSTKKDENGVTGKKDNTGNDNSKKKETELERILKLPPADRPSPYRDGNVIWVTHMDDLECRFNNLGYLWGELKMSDVIRHYP